MLPDIKHVLFATDMSENADSALRYGLSLAKATGAAVHVLNVAEPLSQDAHATLSIFVQDKELRKKAIGDRHEAMRTMLKDSQKRFLAALPDDEKDTYQLISSVELAEGNPAETILQRAKKLDCDLIVMGSHEHSTSHTFLGTVTKRVLRRSSIPVLVVPAGE